MSSLPCGTLSLDKFHSGDDRVLGNLAVAPVALRLNSHILGLVQIVRRPNARWKVRQFVLLDGVWDIKRLPVVVLFIFFLLLLDLPFKWQILVDLRLGSLLLVKPWNNFDVLLRLDIVLVLTSVCRWICCFVRLCHFKTTSIARVSFCKRHLIWLRDWPILNTASLRRLHYERLLSFPQLHVHSWMLLVVTLTNSRRLLCQDLAWLQVHSTANERSAVRLLNLHGSLDALSLCELLAMLASNLNIESHFTSIFHFLKLLDLIFIVLTLTPIEFRAGAIDQRSLFVRLTVKALAWGLHFAHA